MWIPASHIHEGRGVVGKHDLSGRLGLGDHCFTDAEGRSVMLRGINVSGICKIPFQGDGGSEKGVFLPACRTSFVGRPFPLSEARRHFGRLSSWGFHFVRLLVSWEAIEGRGPGIYDQDYINYVARLTGLAGDAGLRVMIDFHQDVWSRFTGGDGAPRWTLEEAGFDVDHMRESGAAFFADQYADNPSGDVWLANHERLACATMFTLFFGGDDFAPRCRARDGTSIQQFLQRHYLNAAGALARALRTCPNVIGFDMMNEPGSGFIGREHLDRPGVFTLDVAPSPLQAFAAGTGIPQQAARFRLGMFGPARNGHDTINPKAVSAWKAGRPCVWRRHGVWTCDANGRQMLVSPAYFASRRGRPVDFTNDYYKPFAERFTRVIRGIDRRYLVFIEEPVLPEHPERSRLPDWNGNAPLGIVSACHWYDIATVITRNYRSWLAVDPGNQEVVLGAGAVFRFFDRQLTRLKDESDRCLGPRPLLVGEFGTPFSRHKQILRAGESYPKQQAALATYYRALENHCLGNALWHYGAQSTLANGDGWNDEDFSVYCADSGTGRALSAVVRPYPLAVPGCLLESRFDVASREFRCRFRIDPGNRTPCVIFVPALVYGEQFEVMIHDGSLRFDSERRFLSYMPDPSPGEHLLVVRVAKRQGLAPRFCKNPVKPLL